MDDINNLSVGEKEDIINRWNDTISKGTVFKAGIAPTSASGGSLPLGSSNSQSQSSQSQSRTSSSSSPQTSSATPSPAAIPHKEHDLQHDVSIPPSTYKKRSSTSTTQSGKMSRKSSSLSKFVESVDDELHLEPMPPLPPHASSMKSSPTSPSSPSNVSKPASKP